MASCSWLWILAFAALFALIASVATLSRRRAWIRPSGPRLRPATEPSTIRELIPESRFVNVNGANIHFIQAGSSFGSSFGEDIVLLHGIGASVFVWRFLFPLLQVQRRVTAFDFAGFGKSSKDARAGYGLDAQAESIAEALTAIGIEKAALVGSSMGGAIALWMARRWPERFDCVMTLGPATDASRVPGIAQHLAITAPFFRRTVNRRTVRFILRTIISNKKLITEDVVDQYLEPFRDRGESLRAFVGATAVLSDRRLPDGLKGLKARTLIVWGAHDAMVARGSVKKLQSVLPDSFFIEHPSAGHHIMEDEPEWLASKLELFLAGADVTTEAETVS